jgi:hypothetical protein
MNKQPIKQTNNYEMNAMLDHIISKPNEDDGM